MKGYESYVERKYISEEIIILFINCNTYQGSSIITVFQKLPQITIKKIYECQ